MIPVLACALGLLVVFAEPIASGFARHTSDPTDPRFTEFLLEHAWLWLRGDSARGLFDLPTAYPLENTLAYAEPMVSFAVFYAPFRMLGFSSGTSHQLWLMLVGALNFACFFAFARRALRFGTLAATASSMLFAFGLPQTTEVGHSQLWAQCFVVAIAWGMFVLLDGERSTRERRSAVVVVCAGFVLQTWGSLYNAIFLFYVCVATAVFAFAHPAWRERTLRTAREGGARAGVALAISLLCVLPVLRAYLAVAATTDDWSAQEIAKLQPRLGSLFHVWPHSWLYGREELAYQPALGVGVMTTGVVVAMLVRQRRSPWVQLLATLFVALWLPTVVFPGGFTIWDDVRPWLPGLSDLRAVGRLGLFFLLPASVALGHFLEHRPALLGRAAGIGIGLLCIVEQGTSVPSYVRAPFDRVVENIAAEIGPNAQAFYYVGAGVVPPWVSQLDAALAAQLAGVPTVNMYSGRYPRGFERLRANVAQSPERTAELRDALDDWCRAHGLDPARVQLVDQNEIRARQKREMDERRTRAAAP